MATELSFTKRAAAELSRCFNGLNVNKNSTASNSKKVTASIAASNPIQATTVLSNNSQTAEPCDSSGISSSSHNFFTLTNSVRSIGNAYEQNILAAKSALKSPFKSKTGLVENSKSTSEKCAYASASPMTPRKQAPKAPPKTNRARRKNFLLSLAQQKSKVVDDLWTDEQFLNIFFTHFTPIEKCELAQVNKLWKQILYTHHDSWKQLVPVINFNELKKSNSLMLNNLYYQSLDQRRFDSLCIYGANDQDIIELSTKIACYGLVNRLDNCYLRNCCISDKGLELLLATVNQKLGCLELNSCNEITDSGLWTGLVSSLHTLIILDCINIADETMAAIAQMLPYLTNFTLQAYHVTDNGFSYFSPMESKHNSPMESLRLLSCWEITNQSILYISQTMPKLNHISFSGCSKLTDDAIELISEQLRHVSFLDLSWCSRITDSSLEYLACDLSDKLETLI